MCYFKNLECEIGIAFIWDLSELSIRYTSEIIEEKEVLLPQIDSTVQAFYKTFKVAQNEVFF